MATQNIQTPSFQEQEKLIINSQRYQTWKTQIVREALYLESGEFTDSERVYHHVNDSCIEYDISDNIAAVWLCRETGYYFHELKNGQFCVNIENLGFLSPELDKVACRVFDFMIAQWGEHYSGVYANA